MDRIVQHGFTLIELMIVVAIIAILAGVAIPAYQDYLIRAQVSEGFSLTESSKVAMAEFYSTKGRFPTNNASAGLAPPTSIVGKYVKSVNVSKLSASSGLITVTYGGEANRAISGKKIVLKGTRVAGSTKWDCTSASGSNVKARYRPSNCRP